MFNTTMPEINVDTLNLSDEDKALVVPIMATRGKNKGRLRASFKRINPDKDPEMGMSRYIWRMVAFYASPHYKHHTMPMMAMFDLPKYNTPEYKEGLTRCDAIVNAVLATIPANQQYGTNRWGQAIYGSSYPLSQ